MQRLSQAVTWIGAELRGADAQLSGACIDTRRLQPGQLFIALPGEQVDGHDFVRRAAALGASGALVSQPVSSDFPQLVVPDVLVAMQQLAANWRREWGGTVVGITGSNGKTSVKTMLAAILARSRSIYATPGNLNNHIGLPLCLLNIRPEQQLAVLEMGASHAGEIAALAAWAAPDYGLITQAGDAHLEGFGGRDQVAAAKGELFQALAPGGLALINADDAYASFWQELAAPTPILRFGRSPEAEVRALDERNTAAQQQFVLRIGDEAEDVHLSLPGRHSVMNALAAAAVAHALGVSLPEIAHALAQVQPVAGRLQVQQLPNGVNLIDDSYNANPGSLRAALDVLMASPGPRHLVLGDMAELGADGPQLHAQAGLAAAEAGVDQLWACGPLSAEAARAFGHPARSFAQRADLAQALQQVLGEGGTVLVKGSRSAGMEQVVALLRGEA